MSKFQGSAGFQTTNYTLVSQNLSGDRQSGPSFTQVFEGTRVALDALRRQFQNAGARVELTAPAGKATLSVTWASNGPSGLNPAGDPTASAASETPTDRWSIDSEPHQISVWKNPGVDEEAVKFAAQIGNFKNPDTNDIITGKAAFRKGIEYEVAAGNAFPFSLSIYPVGFSVYQALVRGEEYWNSDVPIVSLSRTYSLNYTGAAFPVSLKTRVYTRSALIRTFGIPAIVADKIPADPTTPAIESDLIWGWRQRRQSDQYNLATRRVEESRSWEFAAWSRAFYDIVQ